MARLEIDIDANIKDLDKTIGEAESRLSKFATKAQNIGVAMSAALTLPILAIGNASLKAASESEETFSKFDVVFRDVKGSAEDAFQSLRNEYGLSSLASKQLLSDTGDLLTGFGFSQKAALDLSSQVNKLAVDLASFTNFSGGAEGASQALTKALLGERESVKALGISILEEDVKKQVAINTAKGLTFETERQAKAYATLDIAIAQSGNAIGDYARTSDGYSNQQRLLAARIEDLSVSIGSVLIPVANRITGIVLKVVDSFNNLSDSTKTAIVVISGIVAAIGPLLLGIGTAIKLLPVLTAGFVSLKAAVIAATGPFGIITIAIASSIPLLINLNNELKRTKQIAGEVKADLLAESLKTSREEFERLSSALEKGGLKPLEAQNRAIDLLLKQELELLKARKTNKDIDFEAIKARVAALNQLKSELNQVTTATTQTIEEFSKLADIKNDEVFARWTQEADNFNATIAENQRLIKGIEDVSLGIVAEDQKDTSLNGFANIELPPIDTTAFEESVSKADQAIILANSRLVESARNMKEQFRGALEGISLNFVVDAITEGAFAIGQALAEGTNVMQAFGKTLLNAVGSFLSQLGKEMVAYGTAALAMAVLTKALSNPYTAIPAAIGLIAAGAALSLAAGAIQGTLKRGANGSGGGGNVSTGAASSSFTGSGVDTFGFGNMQLTSVVKGTDILLSLERTQNKNSKG